MESLNHIGIRSNSLACGIRLNSELVLEKYSGRPNVFDKDVVATSLARNLDGHQCGVNVL